MAATKQSIKGLRIGVPTAFYVDDLDPEVARVLDETLAVLKREGAEIVKVELPDQRQLTAACQFVLATEAAAFHKRWMIERPEDYGAQVLMRLQNGLAISAVSYLEAMRWRGPALAAYLAAVDGVDAVIAPVAPMPAPTIAESDVGNSHDAEAVIQRLTRFTRPINYLGLPSLSIPTGFTNNGLPVGMQLIGRSFDEAMLVRIGAAFQRATDFHRPGAEASMSNLVEINNLNIRFTGERTVHAVNDLSLTLGEGEVLGLLGESGSGKSVTLARADAAVAEEADADLRQRPGARARRAGARRRGTVGVSRPDRLDDLSGAGAGARSGLHHRPADFRKRDAPRGQEPGRRDGAGAGNAGSGADSLRQTTARCLSARDVAAACGSAP